ncbi:MAG: serine/threonine-protein kinase, partial [Streptomycetales bacterium]
MASEGDPGERVLAGRYRLDAQLGRGGMGIVWRGLDTTLGREVAVKEVLLPPQLPEGEVRTLRQRTLREARAAARLSHPGVVTVYDVVEEDSRPWIVMELLPSRSLAEVIREDGPLPYRRVAAIGLQVLAALRVAHAAGILHRDVKPGNVLFAPDGRAVLTDFGIASVEGDPSLTASGMLLGAPAYIAPERARGRTIGSASDLWSLGATLYAAVEGRAPHERGAALPTLTAVVNDEPDPAELAGPLEAVLDGLLRKDPAERLGAREAVALLEAVAGGGQPASAPPETGTESAAE